jgi:hypothetical protein
MPPHFHVVMSDGRVCLVEIDSLEVFGDVKVFEIAEVIERHLTTKNRFCRSGENGARKKPISKGTGSYSD